MSDGEFRRLEHTRENHKNAAASAASRAAHSKRQRKKPAFLSKAGSCQLRRSLFGDSSDRTVISTSAAANASVSVDTVLSIALGNRAYRTAVRASSATYTSITNLISHIGTLLFNLKIDKFPYQTLLYHSRHTM